MTRSSQYVFFFNIRVDCNKIDVRERLVEAKRSKFRKASCSRLLFDITDASSVGSSHESRVINITKLSENYRIIQSSSKICLSRLLESNYKISIDQVIVTASGAAGTCAENKHYYDDGKVTTQERYLRYLYVEQVALIYYLTLISSESIDYIIFRSRLSDRIEGLWRHHASLLEGLVLSSMFGQWTASWCETSLWIALLYILMWDEVSSNHSPPIVFKMVVDI